MFPVHIATLAADSGESIDFCENDDLVNVAETVLHNLYSVGRTWKNDFPVLLEFQLVAPGFRPARLMS